MKVRKPLNKKGSIILDEKFWSGIERLFSKGDTIAAMAIVCIFVILILLGMKIQQNYFQAPQVYDMAIQSEEPILEESMAVPVTSMRIEYEPGGKFNPNNSVTTIVETSQLFQASRYWMYFYTAEGEVYHAPLTQCKLQVNEEDMNSIRVDWYKGLDHPYVYLNMDGQEFYENVSSEFFIEFTDGMQEFVYQYLTETLPLKSES